MRRYRSLDKLCEGRLWDDHVLSQHVLAQTSVPRQYPVWHLLAACLIAACIAASALSSERIVVLVGATFASVLGTLWLLRTVQIAFRKRAQRVALRDLKQLCAGDITPCFLVAPDGRIDWCNDAAESHRSTAHSPSGTFVHLLSKQTPHAFAAVRRMTARALKHGRSAEILSGPAGQFQVQLQFIAGFQVWRIEQHQSFGGDIDVAAAMITVGRNDTILFMNDQAKALIGARVKSLDRLFVSVSPDLNGPQQVMTSDGTCDVHVSERILSQGRRHLFLIPVSVQPAPPEVPIRDIPVPLLKICMEGEIGEANGAALTLLRRTDVAGQSVCDVFEGIGSDGADWVKMACRSALAKDAQFLQVRGAEKDTYVQVTLKKVGAATDQRVIAVLTDATELKSLEAQFVQSQKMQAIGQLAGGVAHDFNNLLTAISGHCDLLLLRHDPGDQDYADLMQVHQNANRAAALVSQLLAFSRKQTLSPEDMDLRDTLSDLTHLLNRLVGETISLSVTHDPVQKAIRADKRQLEQVIMNLVVNARDAMPQGGEISIETESMKLTSPLFRDRVSVPAGEYVVVRVKDEGTGISPDAMQKIFEPFYTTKRTGEGTGLGLSTAYGIVKQTGGFIFADSEIGQGTCFSLLFPAFEHRGRSQPSDLTQAPALTGGPCEGVVLLVEDEAPVRAFASRALKMKGFDVMEAASAEEALDLLENHDIQVDVFVTDVVMPGMNGPTWVRQAMQQRPDVKVVFVSGYAEGAFQGDEPQVPNSVFLPKPFSLTDLTVTVQNQLN